MFLLNIFTDLACPFRNAQLHIEDSDDEAVGDISSSLSISANGSTQSRMMTICLCLTILLNQAYLTTWKLMSIFPCQHLLTFPVPWLLLTLIAYPPRHTPHPTFISCLFQVTLPPRPLRDTAFTAIQGHLPATAHIHFHRWDSDRYSRGVPPTSGKTSYVN